MQRRPNAAGIGAVVAEFYARIFYRNSVNGGYLVPFETETRLCDKVCTGDELKIDVQAGTLVGGTSSNDFWTNNNASLNIAAGATFAGIEANVQIDALTGGGIFSGGYSFGGTETIGVGNGSALYILEHSLKPIVVGANPFDVELLWEQMFRSTIYFGRKGTALEAISAVDIALWDLMGKATGQPVYNLLGGQVHERLRTYTYIYARPGLPRSRISTSDGAKLCTSRPCTRRSTDR